MTDDQMFNETLDCWEAHFRKEMKKIGPPEEIHRQAWACVRLTRKEMAALQLIGLTEEEAWMEARNLFCIARPPEPESRPED